MNVSSKSKKNIPTPAVAEEDFLMEELGSFDPHKVNEITVVGAAKAPSGKALILYLDDGTSISLWATSIDQQRRNIKPLTDQIRVIRPDFPTSGGTIANINAVAPIKLQMLYSKTIGIDVNTGSTTNFENFSFDLDEIGVKQAHLNAKAAISQ